MDAFERDEVVRRVRSGEREAYRLLVEDLAAEIRSFVAAHGVALDLVEEVVQTAFVDAYLRIEAYQASGTFASWVKGFARNLLRRRLSERARARRTAVETLGALVAKAGLDELEDASVAEHRAARLVRLERCMHALAPQARELAMRRFVDGVPLNRLAQQFKRSRAAIANLLSRVRAALRDCVDRPVAPEGGG
jgi:RNA polymerase sigma-70 factor (ECF subfamily)